MNAMRNAGPGAQAMSLTPDRGQEGNTLARLPSPLPHTATIRTPLPISRPGGHMPKPFPTTLREMSLTPDREGPGREYTCERRPLRRPRAAEDVKIPIVPPTGCEHVPLQPSLNRRTLPPYVRLRFQT